jgi:hypothetical protein
MTIIELYDQLCDKDFQDHYTGNLFFPAYMYMYDAKKEHEIDKEILNIKDKLYRPSNYDNRFLTYLDNKIQTHLSNADEFEVAYVFLKGFGNSYPYIRASRFMNNFEKYIKGFKLIMFYPGEAKNYYSLFGLLKDENLYRAIKLINE